MGKKEREKEKYKEREQGRERMDRRMEGGNLCYSSGMGRVKLWPEESLVMTIIFLSLLSEIVLEMKNSNFQRYSQHYINPSQGECVLVTVLAS